MTYTCADTFPEPIQDAAWPSVTSVLTFNGFQEGAVRSAYPTLSVFVRLKSSRLWLTGDLYRDIFLPYNSLEF